MYGMYGFLSHELRRKVVWQKEATPATAGSSTVASFGDPNRESKLRT
jgi:hypothetical protein